MFVKWYERHRVVWRNIENRMRDTENFSTHTGKKKHNCVLPTENISVPLFKTVREIMSNSPH